ncbi:sulfite exporter TauE/SafE family protein [Oscillatoria amoena NRMC-F 0135]|nr:sulfite exporter TauE/SafE family protein [Oscillatoria amoena NRMC-F 0135]
MESPFLLPLLFFFVAVIYASVGFGGGTSYLALMALLGVDFMVMRPAALLCNIVVVAGGTLIFYREGHLNLKKNLPLVAASIPLAFFGGYYRLSESAFFILLGISLIIASLLLLWSRPEPRASGITDNTLFNVILGGGIGFLSGLVSIGGGIFLAPVLHLINWDNGKKIAALASFFILVNSVAGLLGQLAQSVQPDWSFILPLLISVFIGGQIGSRLGATYFNVVYVRRITALLILVAGVNILKDHL